MTSSKQHRFLAPEVLDEAVYELFELAEKDGVEIALVGGRALQLYGSRRLTGDVDVASYETFGDLPEERRLSFGGFKTHASNGTPADIIIRDDDFSSIYEEAIAKAIKLDDYDVPVVAPEYLAAMKMIAGRGKDSVDFDWLVTKCDDMDLVEARKIVRRHLGPYAAKEFDQAVAEAEWKASREEES